MKPLVSILIPAYNSEEWIAESIQSAMAQTWARKEIIVVDDGSRDRTAEVAETFVSQNVKVVSTQNQGSCAARNFAFQLSRGDYIQWLDHDDLLAPDKIERQLAALRGTDSARTLLSCPRGFFYYSTKRAWFPVTPLWQDLSPVEWLLLKMGQNLPMQTSTWLTSREVAEAAGPWNTSMLTDDDGEYFCRVLMASEATRFVPEARTFHRVLGEAQLSHIGKSDKKREALLRSMKLHVQYLRSLEESERVRRACLAYLQSWYGAFYPDRADLVAELQYLAAQLGGQLESPRLRWKYAWIKPVFGERAARWAQSSLPQIKTSWLRRWDKTLHWLDNRRMPITGNPSPQNDKPLHVSDQSSLKQNANPTTR
jgi:glycosyltransferase involved in cell wall biosynthesis